MNLLSYWWKKGFAEAKEFLDNLGMTSGDGYSKLIEFDLITAKIFLLILFRLETIWKS